MKECIKNDFSKNKKGFILLTALMALLLVSVCCISFYGERFGQFHNESTPVEGVGEIVLSYEGAYTEAENIPLINTYETMLNSELFDMYEICSQFIEWRDYNGSEVFEYGYERGFIETEGKNKSQIDYQGKDYTTTRVKSSQISLNCIDKFNLEIVSGRNFQESDFNLEFGDTIPVLMGYEYSSQYSVGESFDIFYLFGSFKCEVVGFLEEDSFIELQRNIQYLDRDVILPMFNITDTPPNSNELFFQTIYYANKNSGVIVFENSITEEVADEIDQISRENNLEPFVKVFFDNNAESFAQVSTNQMLTALTLLRWLIFALCVVVFAFVINRQIKRNIVDYAVYLLFISQKAIIISMILEVDIVLGFSFVISGAIVLFTMKSLYIVGNLLLLMTLLTFITALYITIRLKHVNFKEYLVERKNEY